MSTKAAALVAAGLVAAAAILAFAPPRQPQPDPRLDRIEEALGKAERVRAADHAAALVERAAAAARTELALKETELTLKGFDSSVRALQKLLAPLDLKLAVAPPPRSVVPPHTVAVLPFKSFDRTSPNREDNFYLATALANSLVEQPRLRVTPLSVIPGFLSADGELASALQAGTSLGVRHVLVGTVARGGYNPNRSAYPYTLHVELIEIETRSIALTRQLAFDQSSGTVRPDSEAAKVLKELAREVGEKVGGN